MALIEAISGAISSIGNAVTSGFQAKAAKHDSEARRQEALSAEEVAQQQVYLESKKNVGYLIQGAYNVRSLEEEQRLASLTKPNYTLIAVLLIVVVGGLYYLRTKNK